MDNSNNTAYMQSPTQLTEGENEMSNNQENLTPEREEREVYTRSLR